jgi:hypothetical protein
MKHELTQRQRWWLSHVRRASASGETLKAYAQHHGISVSGLYDAHSRFSRQGRLDGNVPAPTTPLDTAFVPVRVESARPVCRLQHASGWVIECEEWPAPAWLRALVSAGGGDVSA